MTPFVDFNIKQPCSVWTEKLTITNSQAKTTSGTQQKNGNDNANVIDHKTHKYKWLSSIYLFIVHLVWGPMDRSN
jgi:hypothetical protein